MHGCATGCRGSLIATVFMAWGVVLLAWLGGDIFLAPGVRYLAFAGLVVAGMGLYAMAALRSGAMVPSDLKSALRRRNKEPDPGRTPGGEPE